MQCVLNELKGCYSINLSSVFLPTPLKSFLGGGRYEVIGVSPIRNRSFLQRLATLKIWNTNLWQAGTFIWQFENTLRSSWYFQNIKPVETVQEGNPWKCLLNSLCEFQTRPDLFVELFFMLLSGDDKCFSQLLYFHANCESIIKCNCLKFVEKAL